VSDTVFVGIDVSGQTLQVASSAETKTWQVANDGTGIEQLAAQLGGLKPALVVLEATGGYEFEAACALQAVGLAVAVVNPRTARDFARAMGTLAKTDALDARMLAAFARALHQHSERERFVKPLADAELQRLQALVLRRRQLVQMITSERQRMRISHVAARPSIERVIEFLKAELGGSDAQVAAHVQHHHATLAAALASVPGIGAASVAVLLPRRRLGRRGTAEPRLRTDARPALDLGRARRCAAHPLHGNAHRRAPQPHPQDPLRASAGRRQAQEGRTRGLHAQAADHAQCYR
jgi:transposase